MKPENVLNAAPQAATGTVPPESSAPAVAAPHAYWLIERGSPCEWWAGTVDTEEHWTRDVSKVNPLLRFQTREQAQGEADRIKFWPTVIGSELRVTEHMNCAQPSAKQDTSPQVSHTGGAVTYTSHAHRCMSCGARWYCPHPPGDCRADENVFPSLVLPGPGGPTVFHHGCQTKRPCVLCDRT